MYTYTYLSYILLFPFVIICYRVAKIPKTKLFIFYDLRHLNVSFKDIEKTSIEERDNDNSVVNIKNIKEDRAVT